MMDLSGYRSVLDAALNKFEQQREEFSKSQARMQSVTGTATSPRREVTVTVGHSGELTELSFPTGAYKRMAPAELASVILTVVGEARQQALNGVAEALGPMLPPDLSAHDLVNGRIDAKALFERRLSGIVDEPRKD